MQNKQSVFKSFSHRKQLDVVPYSNIFVRRKIWTYLLKQVGVGTGKVIPKSKDHGYLSSLHERQRHCWHTDRANRRTSEETQLTQKQQQVQIIKVMKCRKNKGQVGNLQNKAEMFLSRLQEG